MQEQEAAKEVKDIYQEDLEFLLSIEEDDLYEVIVSRAWKNPTDKRGGSLFLWCHPEARPEYPDTEEIPERFKHCGCLTQVAYTQDVPAYTKGLTAEIRAVREFHIDPGNSPVPREHLKLFVEWQRKMDALWPDRYGNVVAQIERNKKWGPAEYEHDVNTLGPEDGEVD